MHFNILIILMLVYSSFVGAQGRPHSPGISADLEGAPEVMVRSPKSLVSEDLSRPLDVRLPDLDFSLATGTVNDYFSNTDYANGDCPSCEVEGATPSAVQNLSSMAIKDCACKGYNGQSDDRRQLAQGLEKVCQCYLNQRNTFQPPTAAELTSGYQLTIGFTRMVSRLKLNGLASSLLNGHVGQAIRLGLNAPTPAPAPQVISDPAAAPQPPTRSQYGATLNDPSVAGITSNFQTTGVPKNLESIVGVALLTAGTSSTALGSIEDTTIDNPQDRSALNCVSKRQYVEFKETPSDEYGNENPFYGYLASARNAPFNADDWRIGPLMEKYKTSVDAFIASGNKSLDSDPLINQYKARIKFLFSNPLYLNLFESKAPEANEFQQKLAQNIIKNFYPPSCTIHPASDCALSPSAVQNRRNADRMLFDNSVVRDLVRNQSANTVANILAPYINKKDSFAVPQFNEVTSSLIDKSPSEMGRNARDQIMSLCNTTRFGKSVFESTPQDTEGYYRVEDLLLEVGQENMNGAESGYDKFVKDICQTPRCKTNSFGDRMDQCKNGPLTFAKFYETYSKDHNCAAQGLGCWKDAQKKYLKEYPLVSDDGLYGTSLGKGHAFYSYLGGEIVSSEADQKAVRAAVEDVKSGTAPATLISLTPTPTSAGGEPQFAITSSPRINQSNIDKDRRSLNDFMASVPRTGATTPANTVTADNTKSTDIPVGTSVAPTTNSSRATYVPYVNIPVPTPEEIPQITADAQVARAESTRLESQANALASARSSATDPIIKSTLDAQIAALTDRANAADARATTLEAQLRAADRAARAPASVTAPVATAPVDPTTSSGTAAIGRTQVASGVSNPVTAPIAQPQIQSQPGVQSFGSGSSTVSIPVSSGATTSGSSRRSNATNFSFKYGSDAKVQTGSDGSPSIIVAGSSSTFDATSDFAQAVASSRSVDIGSSIPASDSELLTSKDLPTISKYLAQYGQAIQPGTIVRLNYASAGQPAQELLVAKDTRGRLFFPAVRRLAQMRAALTASSN